MFVQINEEDLAMQCDLCDTWFHCSCYGISPEKYRNFQETSEMSFWFCDKDKKKIESFIRKKEDVSSQSVVQHLVEIKAKVEELNCSINKQQEAAKQSFAEVLRSSNAPKTLFSQTKSELPRKSCSKGLIVQPTSKEVSSKDVEEKIKKSVNLASIKCGVSKMKHIQNSGIFIATANTDPLEKELTTKLGPGYTVSKPKPRVPKLILSGLSREYSEEELLNEVRETNFGFNPNDSFKVVHHKKMIRNNEESWTYIIEAPPNTFNKLVHRYISVDFYDHFVKEHIEAVRCYNCQGYNHKSVSCASACKCARCGRGHKTTECARSSSLSCINCVDSNKKNGTKFNTNHSCGSASCKVHQQMMNNVKSKIDYSGYSGC